MNRNIIQQEYLVDSDAIRRFGSRSRGSVLLLSLLILSAVLAATTVVGSFIVREVRSNKQLDDALLAFYASESGIEEGLWRASVDPKDPELLQERTATFDANTATVKRLGKNRGKSITYPFLANGEAFTLDLYNPDSTARDAGDFASGVAVLAIEATGQLTLASCQYRASTGGLAPCDGVTIDQSYTSLSLDPTKAYRLAWKAGSGDVRDISFSGTRDGGSVDLSTPLTIESTGALTTSRQALRVTLITPSPLSGIPGGDGGGGGTGGGEGGGGGGGTPGTCPSGGTPTTPVITSGDPPGSVTEDNPYIHDVQSNVEGTPGTVYTILASPTSVDPNALVQMNATTGEIRWTPVNDQVGTQTLRYKVTEVCDGSLTKEFFVVVNNDPPKITSVPPLQASSEQEYTYNVENDNDEGIGGTTYTLTVWPEGMTINPATGAIRWPSPAPHPSNPDGRQFVIIEVDDTHGGIATQSFEISVLPETSVLTLTWKRPPFVTDLLYTVFSLPNTQDVWAAGVVGGIIHTENGGGTWQHLPKPTRSDGQPYTDAITGVYFRDSQHGWIVTTGGYSAFRGLSHTNDGGQTWNATTTVGPIRTFSFLPGTEIGWAVGWGYIQPGQLEQQQLNVNDGRTEETAWKRIPVAFPFGSLDDRLQLLDVALVDENTGYVAGRYSYGPRPRDVLFRIKRNGTIELTKEFPEISDFVISRIRFENLNHGWILGSEVTSTGRVEVILETQDAGVTWTRRSPTEMTIRDLELLRGASFPTGSIGFRIVKSGYAISKTTDGGQTWTDQESGRSYRANALSQVPGVSNEWWVAPYSSTGYPSDLLYSADAGETWRRRPEDSGLGLREITEVYFYNSLEGMAFGTTSSSGRLVWTADGGNHWAQSNAPFTITGAGVLAIPSHPVGQGGSAWFGTGLGRIARTNDQGRTWNLQTTPTTNVIRTVTFYDEQYGYATTDRGEFLRTTNGGENWESLPLPSSVVYSVTFGSPQVGWAAYGGSKVYHTAGRGQTWIQQEVGAGNIYALHAFDTQHVLAVGRNGAVRQTTDGGQTWSTPTINHVDRPDGLTAPVFRKIIFPSSREGWILGDDGVIIHVTPGAPQATR